MEDFVALPRQIKYDYIDGKLSSNEYDVLVWIILNTNPFNGKCELGYRDIEERFYKITYDNARKIICNLRRHKYIWFKRHRGRGGKFTIYPSNFLLTSKRIQNYDDFAITSKKKSKEQIKPQATPQLNHNSSPQYHNFQENKKLLMDKMSANRETSITSPYNDKDNDNNLNKNFKENKEHNLKGIKMLEDTLVKLGKIPEDKRKYKDNN